MHATSSSDSSSSEDAPETNGEADLAAAIEHAAHRLPSQGPISVFVHHNTLHAFEDHSFDEALKRAEELYGAQPYLSEETYRRELANGRIREEDLATVLHEELGEDGNRRVGPSGTAFDARLAMLRHPLPRGSDAELEWAIAESEALVRFRPDVDPAQRQRVIEATRHWMQRDVLDGQPLTEPLASTRAYMLTRHGEGRLDDLREEEWEEATLHAMWQICRQGARSVPARGERPTRSAVRVVDLLRRATGEDADALVDALLIRFCGAFADQGFAHWRLPERDRGFWHSFVALFGDSRPAARWLRDLPAELGRLQAEGAGPLTVIQESLDLLRVEPTERETYLERTLLALPGWAGMLWQLETNADWTPSPAPPGTLVEYVAARLLLERLAIAYVCHHRLRLEVPLERLRETLVRRLPSSRPCSLLQRSFEAFQLAQTEGWGPALLLRLDRHGWQHLLEEIEAFSSVERRAVYHRAYERAYRDQILTALTRHVDGLDTARRLSETDQPPTFQLACCIDDREESLRRHLEEVAPDCETFGVAGFFGVAMYYRGTQDAHYVPLCPVVLKPRHFVNEEVVFSWQETHRRVREARRTLGHVTHQWHARSRTALGGLVTGLFGLFTSIPLVFRVLFPRLTSRLSTWMGRIVHPPSATQLRLERQAVEPGPHEHGLGYTLDEMAVIVETLLRDIGLTRRFSRLILFLGHGSSSRNNPHEAAYDCGACGGARGGPNARAFAQMANDPRVRRRLEANGLVIPDQTAFVGAYHNTGDDSIEYYDLDRLPASHRAAFVAARQQLDEARERNAHERCRRFESAPLGMTPEEALRHVEGRVADLSQTRPELGHATNALCIVGRRARTRNLFLDRRAFLTSYDPTQDDEEATILTRILRAVLPVCAGINLEYYFSHVDRRAYGCDSKLPHNVVSLLGVMEGAASDLRPGLPWQMVEMHEAMRILFVIETKPEVLDGILAANPALLRLCKGEWVQVATLDPDSMTVHVYRPDGFQRYRPLQQELPTAASSAAWYRGWRGHLDVARVLEPRVPTSDASEMVAASKEPVA